MVKRLARLPLSRQPGEAFEYGMAADVQGYLVEVVSGMKLEDYMRERIFKPLKMNDTYFFMPESEQHRLSALWKTDWHGKLEKVTDGVRLLSRKTVELMTKTNQIGKLNAITLHDDGLKFGLGVAIQADRSHNVDSGDVGTFEWAGIFSTRFSVDPKEQKITLFMSQTHPFHYHFDLWDKLPASDG
jgi:CubicO group peptidase (beta-lactamase class C family)